MSLLTYYLIQRYKGELYEVVQFILILSAALTDIYLMILVVFKFIGWIINLLSWCLF